MMRSMFSGVSGIKAHQTRMDVIGNNIANINTVGFKGSRTTFSDMLSQMQRNSSAPTDNRGGINPRQIGLGVSVESIDLLFTDASPQQTGKNTDLALSGNGLFVLKGGGQSYYTRNGAFEFDEQGYYVLPGSGFRVQGWNASPEGILDTNGLATDVVVPVGKTMEAAETTKIDYSGNLDKESRVIDRISYTVSTNEGADENKVVTFTEIEDPPDSGETRNVATSVNVDGQNVVAAKITFKDGTTMNVTSGYYEVGKTVPVTTLATIYDSLGGKHEVTILLDKDYSSVDNNLSDPRAVATATILDEEGNPINADNIRAVKDDEGNITSYTYTTLDENGEQVEGEAEPDHVFFYNRWRAYIAPGVGELGPAAGLAPADAAEDELANYFSNSYTRSEANHNPEMDGSGTTGTMNTINYVYFDDRGQFVSNGQDVDGAITFEYFDGNGAASNQAIMSFAGMTQYANRTTSFPTTNGNSSGVLQSVSIDSSGIVIGTYTNGLRRTEAQIAAAQFTNNSGLTKVGTTIYQESSNSGVANIKTLDALGLSVISSALEMSNVDLATEFSEMIITQRGFQANSKMTTVADEMLETLVNMKR